MESQKNIIDAVFIGASPIAIIEAAYNVKKGRKALIIEQKNEIGGAWGVVSLFGAKDIESGCHILDVTKHNDKLLRFMESQLGVKFTVWNPQPQRIYGKKIFAYNSKYYILKDFYPIFRGFLSEVKKKKFISLKLINNTSIQLFNLVKKYFSNYYYWSKKFHYFKDGTAGFIRDLREIISSHKIKVLYETKIESIIVNDEDLVKISTGSEVICCKKVFLTSGSEIYSIRYGNKILEIPIEKRGFKHLFLNIKDTKGKKISYIHDLTHECLLRLNEVTSTVDREWRDSNPENRIFVALIKESVPSDDLDSLSQIILDRMKAFCVVGPESTVLDRELIFQEVFHRSFDNFNVDIPNVEFLRSTNLIKSLNSNLDRWKEAWSEYGS